MNASSSRKLITALSVAVALLPALADAQSPSSPDRLRPMTSQPVAPPTPIPVVTPDPAGKPVRSRPVTIAAPESVTVSDVSTVSTDSFGLSDEAGGGMPFDIWKGSSRRNIDALLPLFSNGIVHEPLRSLATRLLVSSADVPAGESTKSLLGQRLRALFMIGREDRALDMLKTLPESMRSSEMDKLYATILLLQGDAENACKMAMSGILQSDDFQELVIFCQAREGKSAEASLGLDLMREQNREPSAILTQLIEAIGSKKKITTLPEKPATLEAAMLIASGYPNFSRSYLSRAPLPVARSIAASKEAQPEVKAVSAERLLGYGAGDVALLANAYSKYSFTLKELTGPVPTDGKRLSGTKGSALLFQMQNRQRQAAKRIPIIAKAMQQYQDAGLAPVGWQLYAKPVQELSSDIPQSPEARRFAFDAFTILMMNDQTTLADKWAQLLDRNGKDASAVLRRATADTILQFAAASGSTNRVTATSIPNGAQAADVRRIQRLYNVMEVFGYQIDRGTDGELSAQRVSYQVEDPSPDILALQDNAHRNQLKGEMVLTSILALGGSDLGKISDTVLIKTLRVLKDAGYEAEARKIAIQSVLAVD